MSRFQVEVDEVDRNGWHLLIREFDDASIYQTWPYGISGKRDVSHIVVREDGDAVGCCQVVVRAACGVGIADIQWGPMCVKRGGLFGFDALRRVIKAIKEEYGVRRGHFVRIRPHAKGERKEQVRELLEVEGFVRNPRPRPYRTLIVDLSLPS